MPRRKYGNQRSVDDVVNSSVGVSWNIHERLDRLRKRGESFNSVIDRILNENEFLRNQLNEKKEVDNILSTTG